MIDWLIDIWQRKFTFPPFICKWLIPLVSPCAPSNENNIICLTSGAVLCLKMSCPSTKLAYLLWRGWRDFDPSGSCMNYEVRPSPATICLSPSSQEDDDFCHGYFSVSFQRSPNKDWWDLSQYFNIAFLYNIDDIYLNNRYHLCSFDA